FAGLKTALALGRALDKQVEAVSVYDPYLHYAMFNGIVDVLSAEASRVFRFKEQEQLHEEIIDTGLAKIYESHLRVAASIARDEGVELKTTLFDGKAFKKILQYVRQDPPWLLVAGRIGVHSADQHLPLRHGAGAFHPQLLDHRRGGGRGHARPRRPGHGSRAAQISLPLDGGGLGWGCDDGGGLDLPPLRAQRPRIAPQFLPGL